MGKKKKQRAKKKAYKRLYRRMMHLHYYGRWHTGEPDDIITRINLLPCHGAKERQEKREAGLRLLMTERDLTEFLRGIFDNKN